MAPFQKLMTLSSFALDLENSLYYIENALDSDGQQAFLNLILTTELKQPTLKIFGHSPKFFDTTFNISTVPSKHYNQAPMNQAVASFSKLLKRSYDFWVPNIASAHYNCNLVYYSPELANGGNRGKHQDNPDYPLTLVLIYSYGQDRDLTIYRNNQIVHRITLKENSILAMAGPSFQQVYYHQLDKLKNGVVAKDRFSFNTRFMNPLTFQ